MFFFKKSPAPYKKFDLTARDRHHEEHAMHRRAVRQHYILYFLLQDRNREYLSITPDELHPKSIADSLAYREQEVKEWASDYEKFSGVKVSYTVDPEFLWRKDKTLEFARKEDYDSFVEKWSDTFNTSIPYYKNYLPDGKIAVVVTNFEKCMNLQPDLPALKSWCERNKCDLRLKLRPAPRNITWNEIGIIIPNEQTLSWFKLSWE